MTEATLATEDPRVAEYRRLRSMGIARPKDAPLELWNAAGPYTMHDATELMRISLENRVIEQAQQPLPKDEKAMLQAFFPQAVATRVSIMTDPEAKNADRLIASSTFIDHTVGKPDQHVNVTGSLAIEVHNQLEKLVRDIKSGTVIDSDNLLAKPKTPVDNFIEKHMPKGFIVGKKVAPDVQEGQPQPAEGLSERAVSKD